MKNTKDQFDSRKEEIEFCFKVMRDIERLKISNETESNIFLSKDKFLTEQEDNNKFLCIMKSNFLLMLYNLVESCIKTGFEEIYGILESEHITWIQANNALRKIYIWLGNTVQPDTSILLKKEMFGKMAGGTLDARNIRDLLEKHDINFKETHNGDKSLILRVKSERNSLAHGDKSFYEATRDLPLDNLVEIKDEVFTFIEDVINAMEDYCNNKLYLNTVDKKAKLKIQEEILLDMVRKDFEKLLEILKSRHTKFEKYTVDKLVKRIIANPDEFIPFLYVVNKPPLDYEEYHNSIYCVAQMCKGNFE